MKKVFLQDDDCHWYLVPVDKAGVFNTLQDQGEEDGYAAFNNSFEEYRCDHPSFYSVGVD